MSEIAPKQSLKSRPLNRGRKIVIGLGVAASLLIVLFLVLTSTAFLKRVVLPGAGDDLNAQISATDLVFKPFSGLVARGVKVVPTGMEPLLELAELRIRYSLASFLLGKPEVHEVTLVGPQVRIVQSPDGRGNWTPLQLAIEKMIRESKPKPPGSDSPTILSLKKVSLENGSVRFTGTSGSGAKEIIADKIRLTLDQFQNDQQGTLSLSSALTLTQTATENGRTNLSRAAGKFEGSLGIRTDAKLSPSAITASGRGLIESGDGSFAAFRGSRIELDGDLSESNLKGLNLTVLRGEDRLAAVQAKGSVNLTTMESRINVELLPVDKRFLNLIGSVAGLDFMETTLTATVNIESSKGGQALGTKGAFKVDKLEVRRAGRNTPRMNLDCGFDFSVDGATQSMVVRQLDLTGLESGRRFLFAKLARPLSLGWGGASAGFPGADFEFAMEQFEMAKWKPLIGESLPSGFVSAAIKVAMNQDAKSHTGSASVDWNDLALASDSPRDVGKAALRFRSGFRMIEARQFILESASLDLSQGPNAFAKLSATGVWSGGTGDFKGQGEAAGQLGPLASFLNISNVNFVGGEVKIGAQASITKDASTLTAEAALNGLKGVMQSLRFDDYTAVFGIDGTRAGETVSLKRANLRLRKGSQEGGVIDVTGGFGRFPEVGKFDFRVVDLNQDGLAPILSTPDGGSKLASISFASRGSASFDPGAESLAKGELVLTNLMLNGMGKNAADGRAPLSASVAFDATGKGRLYDLKQMKITVMPTPRAGNEIVVTGRLDLSATNASASKFSVRSDGLDLTPVLDFLQGPRVSATPKPDGKGLQAVRSVEEPPAVQAPISDLSADVRLGRVFLRETVVSNLVSVLNFQTNVARLNPFQLMCNGASLTASSLLDLSKPGYAYELNLRADKIPVEPLANSFAPAYKGQAKGDLSVFAEVKGSGVTDASLRDNLVAKASASFTNANIQLVGPKVRLLLTPIAVLLRVPELLQSPMNSFDAQIDVAQGNLNIKQVALRTEAFQATATGVIPLQPILTNSPIDVPIVIALRRSIAQKSNLISASAPPDAPFVTLPTFATVRGTLGTPETKTDGLVLAGLGLKAVAGLPQAAGEKVGNIIQGIGNLLTGDKPASASTNQNPALKTNAPAKRNPLDLFRSGPDKKEKKP